MRRYTYNGDEGRYYPALGLTPEPGKRYSLERNPGDGRWTPPDPDPQPETPETATEGEQTKEGSDA